MGFKLPDLLKMLQEEAVREEIRKIVQEKTGSNMGKSQYQTEALSTYSESQIRSLRIEIERLNNQLRSSGQEIENLKMKVNKDAQTISEYTEQIQRANVEKERIDNHVKQVTDKYNSLAERYNKDISVLKSRLSEAEAEKDALKSTYAETEELFNLYRNLSEDTRDSLSNVVCDVDMMHFVCSLSNEDNLRRIWEYIKGILSYEDCVSDIESLTKIFDYFFKLYNTSLAEAVFRMDDTEIGDDYDDNLHAKARGSASSGSIRRILLRGYVSVNTGRPICKSVVYV